MERRTAERGLKKKTAARRSVRSGNHRRQTPFKLVTRRQIRAVVERIVESVHPQQVILFGSYAYGEPSVDSDVDFLVIMESRMRPAKRAVRIERNLLDIPFPMDILVRTPAEVAHRLHIGDYFMQEIIDQGQILYGPGRVG